MITMTEGFLIIKLDHGNPEELRENLQKAIASALRYYATSENKRYEDSDLMAELCDLQQALASQESAAYKNLRENKKAA